MRKTYSPETEPLFQGTTNQNSVNLSLTTLCTMKCPLCSYAVPKLKAEGSAKHASVENIIRDSEHMQYLKRIHLTGGEATMHPLFREIASNVRAWFKPQLLTIETNGTYYFKYRDLFQDPKLFDRVFITHYVKDQIYSNNFDSTSVIELAERDCSERLLRDEPVTHDRGHNLTGIEQKDARPCTRWYKPGLPAGWYHGLLYPCCVTYGIDQKQGIPVTPDWRHHIMNVDMLCSRCCFVGT